MKVITRNSVFRNESGLTAEGVQVAEAVLEEMKVQGAGARVAFRDVLPNTAGIMKRFRRIYERGWNELIKKGLLKPFEEDSNWLVATDKFFKNVATVNMAISDKKITPTLP